MIEQRVIQVVASSLQVRPEAIEPKASFEELGIDSLHALTVIHDIEEEFGITIPSERAVSLETVDDIITNLEKFLDQD